MDKEVSLCVICAWRKDCQKRFSKREGVSFRCPDFSRDITVRNGEDKDDKEKDKRRSKKSDRDL